MQAIPPRCRATMLALLVSAGMPAAGTEAWKWIDPEGRTHYGDRPPGPDAEAVRVDSAPPADPDQGARSERRDRLLQIYADERAERRMQEEQSRREQEARAQQCERARRILADYRQAAYIYDKDADGARRILSDAEHAQALAEAERAVAEWCRPAPAEP